MAFADRYTGEALVIKALPTGGSEITITADYTAFSYTLTTDNVDVTAGSEYERSALETKEGMTWSIDVFDGNNAIWDAFTKGAKTGNMCVYERGVGTGLPCFSFNYLIDSADHSTGTDQASTLTVSGIRVGAMVTDFGFEQA